MSPEKRGLATKTQMLICTRTSMITAGHVYVSGQLDILLSMTSNVSLPIYLHIQEAESILLFNLQ